ncbi:PadR family transcriptional regulator [Streptomyces sp. KR80]|uniref:PadR family transcriptional regulator n=1 Tax=Streptomyces sp. KR80 TaxID=3457426 RepID=UPI003FD6029F
MPPVFAHGRLRLYLLKLLDEAPRHGYEVIRLLEERFQGLYAPSAGTVYPRLAKLEAEGLVTHATEGGRKVYSITDAGLAELADRQGELAELEQEIRESVSELAAEIREDVRGSASDLRREMRAAAREARTAHVGKDDWEGDKEAWRRAKEEMRRAKEEWKEQARRAKEESRRARQEAQQARKQAAQGYAEEVQRIARHVQDQVQSRANAGDWQSALHDGMTELARQMGDLGKLAGPTTAWPPYVKPEPADVGQPEWAEDPGVPSADPARDLERLLDRFRDDVRDAARDHGVSAEQLREARRHLSTAAAHLGALLRAPKP